MRVKSSEELGCLPEGMVGSYIPSTSEKTQWLPREKTPERKYVQPAWPLSSFLDPLPSPLPLTFRVWTPLSPSPPMEMFSFLIYTCIHLLTHWSPYSSLLHSILSFLIISIIATETCILSIEYKCWCFMSHSLV